MTRGGRLAGVRTSVRCRERRAAALQPLRSGLEVRTPATPPPWSWPLQPARPAKTRSPRSGPTFLVMLLGGHAVEEVNVERTIRRQGEVDAWGSGNERG